MKRLMMKKILLFKTEKGWMAQAEELKELFGTDTISTPFTVQAPASYVLKEIRFLNPEAEVSIKI